MNDQLLITCEIVILKISLAGLFGFIKDAHEMNSLLATLISCKQLWQAFSFNTGCGCDLIGAHWCFSISSVFKT